jgi:N-acyl-D-amino-acid deacylase
VFDLVLRGGTVIDGTRAPRRTADVGIVGDRIAAVGTLGPAEARESLDCRGHVVAPGFVDVHNHSDGWLLRLPNFVSKTIQGFTSEVIMADGIGYAPVDRRTARQWMFYLKGLDALRMDEYAGWESIADYLGRIHGRTSQNVLSHVPYANVRVLACGWGRQAVDDFQMRQIRAEIRKGMAEGAVGLSTGLDYVAQCFSTTEELAEACRVVAEFGGLYVTHIRYKAGRMEALREAVEIGRRSGAKVHISHLKGEDARQTEEILEWIDREARRDVDFSFDVYPYQPGSTMLNYLLPYEVWEDGPLAALGRLADPDVKARFAAGLRAYPLPLDRIRIAWTPSAENAVHQGKTLAEYVAERGGDPEDVLFDLLIEERLAVLLVFEEGRDEWVRPLLQHDLYMMGSDGLFFEGASVHPRQFGSAARLLGPCVRDWKLFPLEDAVAKLSGIPAARFGLAGRGTIAEGKSADVVVFDPETVADVATYRDPRRHAVGVRDVFVNGAGVIRHGAPVELSAGSPRPGRALRFGVE